MTSTAAPPPRARLLSYLEHAVAVFLEAGCTCRGTHDDARPRCALNVAYERLQWAHDELTRWDDARAAVAAVLDAPPIDTPPRRARKGEVR